MSVKLFNVAPSMPEKLEFLETLSNNLWWCWHPLAIELFVRMNPKLWREVKGNTKLFLTMVSEKRLKELANDQQYLRQLNAVKSEFERSVPAISDIQERSIAYFSMEFGIHESVRIFSGGLGVLSGDHLKAASDLRLPLVSVGLLYREGYFRQVVDRNGWQMERYPKNEIHNMPLVRARDTEGNDINITLPLIDRTLHVAVWVMWVGNIPLVLLDTELPENPPDLRDISWRLYGGDKTMRVHQEILLGVGGYKALVALGCNPKVCHMNEGHASFLSLARLEHICNQGVDFETALEAVWRSNIFTTHTPVPAGNEVFDIALVRPYLTALAPAAHVDVDRFIKWGIPIYERENSSEMSMTVLGLRLANYSNGVSELHGQVAREMWQKLWPQRSISEVPITHITNGVHVPSWISQRIRIIFDRYLTPMWAKNPDTELLTDGVNTIPNEELWMTHELNRQSMVRAARHIYQHSGFCTGHGKNHKSILSPDALTIGFARRFATYKRGTLLLRNAERLLELLRDTERPIQFVFAGKAHPADEGGKRLIQDLIQFARDNGVEDRLVFLEDYDIGLARSLVQGVDVWLNNPRRPEEASGTSGMKAAINGVINCSILDGWWAEACTPECGWAILGNENFTDTEDADNYESQQIFNLLEDEIIPCFYDRDASDIPHRWIEIMKGSISMALGNFSSARMVEDYDRMFYTPARSAFEELTANNFSKAGSLVAQKGRFVQHFAKMSIQSPVVLSSLENLHVGDSIKIAVQAYLGELSPEDIKVEVYYGDADVHNNIVNAMTCEMAKSSDLGSGNYEFECEISCCHAGRFSLTARITPAGHEWDKSVPGFICWAQD